MKSDSPIQDEINRIAKLPKIQFGTRHSKGLDNIKFDSKNKEIILPMACEPKHVKITDAIKIANFILKHATKTDALDDDDLIQSLTRENY